jgi:uncharacterized repeat protein (TIGR01451 family)
LTHTRILVLVLTLALAVGGGLGVADSKQTGPHPPLVAARNAQASGLSIRTSASRRTVTRGGTIAFAITVTNHSEAAVREVTICDQLPASVARVLAAGGLRLFAGTACRTLASVAAQSSVTVWLLVMIARHARGGTAHNTALVIWEDHRATASASYRIAPPARRCRAG